MPTSQCMNMSVHGAAFRLDSRSLRVASNMEREHRSSHQPHTSGITPICVNNMISYSLIARLNQLDAKSRHWAPNVTGSQVMSFFKLKGELSQYLLITNAQCIVSRCCNSQRMNFKKQDCQQNQFNHFYEMNMQSDKPIKNQ